MRLILLSLFLFFSFTSIVKSQVNFIHQDSVFARSSNCLLGIYACIDSFQYEDLNKYNFFLNNAPYSSANIKYCRFDSIFGYSYFFLKGKTPPFTLTNWIVNNRVFNFTFSDLNVLKDSMRRWTTATPNWIYNADNALIYQINSSSINLPAQVITSSNGTVRDTVGLNRGILYQGARLNVTSGINKFIVQRKSDNISDTVIIAASCFSPQPKYVRFTLSADSAQTFCTDTTNFIARIKSIENICPKNDIILKITALYKSCVSYKAIGTGTDTLCLKVCDALGFCDTTQLIVTVLAKNQVGLKFHILDSVYVDSIKQRCDVLIPQGTLTVRQSLTFSSPLNAKFNLDGNTNCITFSGVNAGLDSIGVRICSGNICDTTILVIKVLQKVVYKSRKYFYADSIGIDSTTKVCLNLPQQTSSITKFNNYCSGNSKGNVTFTTDDVRQCVFYSGTKVGSDTACFQLCNNLGVCDTSYFYITAFARKVNTIPVATSSHVDTLKIKINQSVSYCPDTSRLRNSPIKSIGYCELSNHYNVSIGLDTTKKCVKIKGVKVGVDTFCLVLKNQAGFSDTTRLFVKVSADTLRTQVRYDSVNIFVNDNVNYCYTDSSFLGAKIDTFYNSCPTRITGSSQITQTIGTRCFKIQGLIAGSDTICLRTCSFKTNLCDSVIVFINVRVKDIPKPTKIDSVKVSIFGNATYCLNNLQTGTVLSFCSTIDTKKSTKIIKNNCISITGNAAGKDTICVTTCKPSGVCDTTKLFITVAADTVKAGSHQKNLIIKIGTDTLICLDTTVLRSPIDTFFDNCPGLNGLYARISPKIFSRCIDIKGVRAGTDTACYVICNKARTICDTTIFVVTVLDTAFINLHAFDDFDTTRLNRIKEVDVYANDSLGGKIPTSLTIITPPTKGTATVISITKGFINYETSSSPQSCGIDSFRYRVCNGTTCSEATVTIYVQCADSLFVYNAISPNGDGINDNFVIDGLQNYTDNTLLIFNRWGNQIFKTVNYQNDWQGQWNGSELPDGTYFFFLYDNTKNILLKNGYIQINR